MSEAPTQAPTQLPAKELPAKVLLAGVLGLIAVVHLPLLRFGFIYDDGWTLRSNGFLRAGQFDLALLFSPEAAARHVPDAFRPTLVVFDALSLRVLGLEAWAHHGLSIVLHLGVCLLLARLLRRLGVGEELTLASVAAFGLLAIHAEAVAVISFREDLLAAGLGLGALSVALRSMEASSNGRALAWGIAAMLLEALACGAKLSAAPLPALLLLLAWLKLGPRRKPGEADLGPERSEGVGARGGEAEHDPSPARRPNRLALAVALLGVGVALALAQSWLVHQGSPYGVDNPRILAEREGLSPILAASTQIHVGYVQQMLAPLNLSPEYVDRGARWASPKTVLASATLLALVIAAVHPSVRRRAPLLSFTILAWLLLCVPTSNLVGMPNMRADRFMYLPSVPICIGVAAGLLLLGRRLAADRADAQQLAWLPLCAFVLIQGSFGMAAARVYVSNTTLWHTAVKRAPESARAHALLGLERVGEARQGERLADDVAAAAERSCMRAQQLDPLYELPQLCLGALAIAREQWALAYEHHARAIELSVDRNDRPIAALAQLALDLPSEWIATHPEIGDRREHALALLDRGLRAYPYSPELHAAAARVHHRLGQPERALELYRRARSLRPDRWETVAGGVELALDLGDAAAAHRTWWAEAELLERADPATRTRLVRRLATARTQLNWSSRRTAADFSLLHSLLNPGVFPDEP